MLAMLNLFIGGRFLHAIDDQLESGVFARSQFKPERLDRPIIQPLERLARRFLCHLDREVVAPGETCRIVDGRLW